MDIKKKSDLIMFFLVIAIVASVFIIYYLRNHVGSDEKVLKCISEKSHLYISRTCSFCAQQKIILGDYVAYFNMTDCLEETKTCIDKGITKWPAWEIGNQTYFGLKSVEELQELAGC